MLGIQHNESLIETEIYHIMEEEEFCRGIDIYEEKLVDEITEYFTTKYPAVEWNLACSSYPDCTGGVCAVSWIEKGHLHMIMFDYRV